MKIKRVIAWIALMVAVTGCEKATHVSTSGGGHSIRAVIVGAHSIDSQAGRGTISSPFGKIRIERDRAQIDDNPWTKIPESIPVEVRISKGKVSLSAGSVTVQRTVR